MFFFGGSWEFFQKLAASRGHLLCVTLFDLSLGHRGVGESVLTGVQHG